MAKKKTAPQFPHQDGLSSFAEWMAACAAASRAARPSYVLPPRSSKKGKK